MLRRLMDDGLIPKGFVDERSITEVDPDELKQYIQCHFFAGIGGWSNALLLSDWPYDRQVWTGSCPCQPFSSAGRQAGKTDDRHLWPVWERLIRECKPATIFGEQVATAITKGWLDDVYQGLEAEGYAVGSAVLPACSVGSPHKRDRLWFVAHSIQSRLEGQLRHESSPQRWKEPERSITQSSFWDGGQWTAFPDGKTRFVEPGLPLLAYGLQHRRPLLHAIGNAIVPQVAAEFIKAAM